MGASIADFLAMLATERGAARNTVLAYGRDLEQAEELIGISLEDAQPAQLARLGQGWSSLAPATLARKVSALRQFFGFLVDEGLREDDPTHALPRPATRRPLPKILSHAEVEALFATAEEEARGNAPLAVRMLALLEMLYGSGLRATELVSLPLSAVPRDAPFLTVTGKGGHARMVPVSQRADTALKRWLALREGKSQTESDPRSGRCADPIRFGSFPRAAGTFRACACSSCSRRWRCAPTSRPRSSARMSCGTPSPRICSKAGLICARCRRCWAMRIFRPRKSIRMSMPRGW